MKTSSHFLLTSYLLRYSKKWSFIGDETRAVGAIYSKEQKYNTYDEALARAVADSEIELTQDDVCEYLLQNHYRLRKGDFSDIISMAYQIRMREE